MVRSTTDEPYLWHRLAYHLRGAGREDELYALLLDFDWLQAKLDATDVNALLADYNWIEHDSDLQRLHNALLLSAYGFAEDSTQLPGQLWGRLMLERSPCKRNPNWRVEAPKWNAKPLCCLAMTADGRVAVSGHRSPMFSNYRK